MLRVAIVTDYCTFKHSPGCFPVANKLWSFRLICETYHPADSDATLGWGV